MFSHTDKILVLARESFYYHMLELELDLQKQNYCDVQVCAEELSITVQDVEYLGYYLALLVLNLRNDKL